MVDSNEEATSPRTVELMRKHFGKSLLVFPKLVCGDVNIPLSTGMLAIERKEVHDLLSSIGDGRLFDQVERMQTNCAFAAILVIGNFSYSVNTDKVVINGETTSWDGKSVRNALKAVQWGGVAVVFTTLENYCDSIYETINLAAKPSHEQRLVKKRSITFPPIDERIERIARILPDGMAVKLADSLMRFLAEDTPGVNESNPYGNITVAQAICWISMMGISSQELGIGSAGYPIQPKGWGNKSVINSIPKKRKRKDRKNNKTNRI